MEPALLLALAALGVAVVTVVLTWRTHAVGRHLALEMVQLRDRLAQVERLQRERVRRDSAASERPEAAGAAEAHVAALTRRVDELDRQVAQAIEQGEALALAGHDEVSTAPGHDPDVRDLVRRGLRQQGYRRVYVLDVTPDRKVVVEAERAGITAKGLAWVEPDGQVVMRSRLSHRAFP